MLQQARQSRMHTTTITSSIHPSQTRNSLQPSRVTANLSIISLHLVGNWTSVEWAESESINSCSWCSRWRHSDGNFGMFKGKLCGKQHCIADFQRMSRDKRGIVALFASVALVIEARRVECIAVYLAMLRNPRWTLMSCCCCFLFSMEYIPIRQRPRQGCSVVPKQIYCLVSVVGCTFA